MAQQVDVQTVEELVLEVLRECVEEPDLVSAEATLEDLGVDSLDLLELAQMVHEEHGIELSPDHFADLTRVGDVIRVVREQAG